ncbi:FAD-dependent oxidoreductase [Candidatus Woesearchaeota archaeon]|nr:FAD-dependent oxidoreductase [Candidatus Woesearchaeota archaeon]
MRFKMVYDLIVIGSGPAGLTAGLYASRYMLKTLIIGEMNDSAAVKAIEVCNFPTRGRIGGLDLMQKMRDQVKELGAELNDGKVVGVEKKAESFVVKTNSEEFEAKNIILAMGKEKRKLNLKDEDRFLGKGVSYCATCDAAFYGGKEVAVIGGSDSALTTALLLSKFADKVYIIYRKEKFFRAVPSWVKEVEKNDKIETVFNAEVVELVGDNFLQGVKLKDGKELAVEGLFVEVGSTPSSELAKDLSVDLDDKSYVKVNEKQETNVSGVFACGDVTNNVLKQIITACSEGAVAAFGAYGLSNE